MVKRFFFLSMAGLFFLASTSLVGRAGGPEEERIRQQILIRAQAPAAQGGLSFPEAKARKFADELFETRSPAQAAAYFRQFLTAFSYSIKSADQGGLQKPYEKALEYAAVLARKDPDTLQKIMEKDDQAAHLVTDPPEKGGMGLRDPTERRIALEQFRKRTALDLHIYDEVYRDANLRALHQLMGDARLATPEAMKRASDFATQVAEDHRAEYDIRQRLKAFTESFAKLGRLSEGTAFDVAVKVFDDPKPESKLALIQKFLDHFRQAQQLPLDTSASAEQEQFLIKMLDDRNPEGFFNHYKKTQADCLEQLGEKGIRNVPFRRLHRMTLSAMVKNSGTKSYINNYVEALQYALTPYQKGGLGLLNSGAEDFALALAARPNAQDYLYRHRAEYTKLVSQALKRGDPPDLKDFRERADEAADISCTGRTVNFINNG